MSFRTALIGATLVAVPLAGFLGLRPALADNSPACGALTRGPACGDAGLPFRDAQYQVSNTLDTGTAGTTTWLCKGGPSLKDRDTALGDNLFQLLSSEDAGVAATVATVTDETGRLVGYTATVTTPTTSDPLSVLLYVTCVDDHPPMR